MAAGVDKFLIMCYNACQPEHGNPYRKRNSNDQMINRLDLIVVLVLELLVIIEGSSPFGRTR